MGPPRSPGYILAPASRIDRYAAWHVTLEGVRDVAELMSERLRQQLAWRLGVAHLVQQDYWGHVPARECGALVREAIRLAEQALAGAPAAAAPGPAAPGGPAWTGWPPAPQPGAPARPPAP